MSRYRIVEPLGSGGMGIVYKAQETRLRRMVALKFLSEPRSHDPEALRRFEREARAVSALSHPNICTLFDIGEYEARPFLVLELLDGQTLQRRIQRGPLTLDEIFDFGIHLPILWILPMAKGSFIAISNQRTFFSPPEDR